MCKREANDTWYSYAFRQVCEKSWAVLAIAGFAVLYWYAGKAEENEKELIELIQQGHRYQEAQTKAMTELVYTIREELKK